MSPQEKLLERHNIIQAALEFGRGVSGEPIDILLEDSVHSAVDVPVLSPKPKLSDPIVPVDRKKFRPLTQAEMRADLDAIEAKNRLAHEKVRVGLDRRPPVEKKLDLRDTIKEWAEEQGMTLRTAELHSLQITRDLQKDGWKSLTEAQVRQTISVMLHRR